MKPSISSAIKKLVKKVVLGMPVAGALARRYRALTGRVSMLEARLRSCQENQRNIRYLLAKYLPTSKRAEALQDWWRWTRPNLPLDLRNPQSYNEKIQLLKLAGEDPLLTRLADKYAVRDWVAERIGAEYLVPLLGVWDRVEDIEFERLPEKFALKANHGSGMNIIVTDKSSADIEQIKRTAKGWLGRNFAFECGFEMQYAGIKPRIIAEEYLENGGGDIYDYKFWCFKGRCHYIQFLSERRKHLKMVFFDTDWNKMPFVYDHVRNENPPPRPDNLDKMISLAEKLAAGFEHVRVDFYRLDNGDIRFGEMTFTSASGGCHWDPPEWNLKLGRLFDVRPGNRCADQ